MVTSTTTIREEQRKSPCSLRCVLAVPALMLIHSSQSAVAFSTPGDVAGVQTRCVVGRVSSSCPKALFSCDDAATRLSDSRSLFQIRKTRKATGTALVVVVKSVARRVWSPTHGLESSFVVAAGGAFLGVSQPLNRPLIKKILVVCLAALAGSFLGRKVLLSLRSEKENEAPESTTPPAASRSVGEGGRGEEVNRKSFDMLLARANEAEKTATELAMAAQKAALKAAAAEQVATSSSSSSSFSTSGGATSYLESLTNDTGILGAPAGGGGKILVSLASTTPPVQMSYLESLSSPSLTATGTSPSSDTTTTTTSGQVSTLASKEAVTAKDDVEAEKAVAEAREAAKRAKAEAAKAKQKAQEERAAAMAAAAAAAVEKNGAKPPQVVATSRRPLVWKKRSPKRGIPQPRPPSETQALLERYAAIPSLEDRAFQILLDLGLIKETPDPADPQYDSSRDDELCEENNFV